MDIIEIGYDQWFAEKYYEMNIPDCRPARVSAVYRDSYNIIMNSVKLMGSYPENIYFQSNPPLIIHA